MLAVITIQYLVDNINHNRLYKNMGVESAIICDGGAIFIAIMKYLHRHAQDPARKWIPPSAIELDVIQVLCLNRMSPLLVAFIACPYHA